MTEPTDAELAALIDKEMREYSVGAYADHGSARNQLEHFARAVLAKWGTPAPVGVEPVAFLVCTEEGDPDMVFLDRLEACQYCEDDDPPKPLYTTPQPTQAQAGAVPLTDEQLAEMMRETWGCASIAPRHAMKFARAIEAAHCIGIKGGQHGTE